MIINKSVKKNDIINTNVSKILVLKVNNNKNKNDIGENKTNINKTNTNYRIKIKNIFKLKFSNSNDISIGLDPKKLEKMQKNITQINNKKISFDYNDNCSSIIKQNQTDNNSKRNRTLFNKRDKFNDINDEQSYAFQNLINLNNLNKKGNNEQNLKDLNDFNNNKSYNIEIKKPFHKKRLEKSPESIKFFLTETKNYCHDEKIKKNSYKNNDNPNNINNLNKNIDIIIEKNMNMNMNKIKKNKNINCNIKPIQDLKEINEDNNENTVYHKTLPFNHRKNEKSNFEYDGDMETVTCRYHSQSKNKNKGDNYSLENKDEKNSMNNNLNIKIENNKKDIEIIEPKNNKLNKINYETFCSGFFVSGIPIPIKEDLIIDESNNFISSCGHKLCSLLSSIQPEILYYYTNQGFEISKDFLQKISNLSFPLGIKICIEISFENKIKIQDPQQIFYNIIENNRGEKLYMCTKYYYINIKNDDFKKIYNFDISSFLSEKISKNINNNNNFKKYILTISKLLNGNFSFYIPESITLISKKPFLIPMSICMNGFISSFFEERKDLINHIINEVPIPIEIGPQIKFYIPPYSSPILLNNECNIYKSISKLNKENQKDIFDDNYLSMEQLNYQKLFDTISIDYIIFIFSMILLEQKILFICNNYETLSQIIFIFISLIYPFSLENSHIFPIISLKTINLLEKYNSFIAGMDECLFYYIDKNNNNIFNTMNNNIIIYNINQKCFVFYKNKKKINRKDLLHEYKLFPLPEKINYFLIKELKNVVNYIKINQEIFNQKKNSNVYDLNTYNKFCFFKQNIEIEIKKAFIKSMIMLIGDFNNYTYYIEEEKPLFNKEAFIESHKDKDFKNFLNQVINTTLFDNFLENLKKIYLLKIKNINEIDKYNEAKIFNISFFINLLSQNQELINNQQLRNILNKRMNSDIYLKIKNICSKLTLINNSNKNETKKSSQNKNNQIKKKKTNVLFSGKNYLEDKPKYNIKDFSEKHLDEYKSFNSGLKESKISTESTALSAYINTISKNDIKESNISLENKKIVYIDINNKNSESNNKNKFGKIYLLAPYFLYFNRDEEDYIKEKKTENIIMNDIIMYKRKKNIKERYPPHSILFSTISKYIDYNSYNIKSNKLYMIKNYNTINIKNCKKNNNDLKDITNFNKEVKSFKAKYFKEEISEKDIIDINNIYGNDEELLLINDSFKSCFINKPEINNQHLLLLKRLFSNLENIEHFANLIIPKIFLNRNFNNFKQLTISSFNTFSKILKLCFENLNDNDNNLGRILTKASFIYYKIEKDKVIFLYSNFAFNKSENNQYNCQPYILWKTETFWIEFFNSEFECNIKEKEDNDEIYEIDENDDLDKKDKKDKYDAEWRKKMCLINIVIGVSNIMNKLNLGKNFIINIIEKIILPVFVNDFHYINRIMNLALTANNIN